MTVGGIPHDFRSERQADIGRNPSPAPKPDSRPATSAIPLETLQRTAGNRATAHYIARLANHGGGATDRGVLQRMVAVAKKSRTDDFVENASIHFGLQRGGGPVGQLASLNYSGLGFGDQLFIVAHGKPGSAGDYSASQIAAFLSDRDKGIKKHGVNVLFTSCNAGTATDPLLDDSVVAIVSKALADKGLANYVAGATGASLKHDEIAGGAFTAIEKERLGEALVAQNAKKDQHEPQQKFDAWLKAHPRATDVEKAAAASSIAREFYKALILQVRQGKLHIEDAKTIERRAHWG